MKKSIVVLLLLIFFSCQTALDKETYHKFQQKGNDVSNLAQSTLLANVVKAIQQGGPEYAVEFCNLEVSGITDSLNQINGVFISRVSAKNRNPLNGLQSPVDQKLWNIFENSPQMDTVIQSNNKVFYYKRINIAMPACLKCHGNPDSDLNEGTREILQTLYPHDLATGYQLNDFRGLWKIEFQKGEEF